MRLHGWMGSALVVVAVAAAPAHAQFRNQGITLPEIGYLSLGTFDLLLNQGHPANQHLDVRNGAPDPGWNLFDEPEVGVAYYHALGYDLWGEVQVLLGAWTTVIDTGTKNTPVITVMTSPGVRYNFLEERVRPFVSVHLDYLQLFALANTGSVAPVPGNGFLGNNPFFIGVRPAGGVEWIFGDEQGLIFELGATAFLVPDKNRGEGGLFLPAGVARVGYQIFF